MTREFHVVGAGFTGMLAAYLLVQRGHAVTVTDAGPRPGGMIRTEAVPGGDAESAANGFLASALLEEVAGRIGVTLVQAAPRARKQRWLWVDGPSRWPLSLRQTLGMALRAGGAWASRRMAPRPLETLEAWGVRVLGQPATHRMLGSAVLGIYAAPPAHLSATLVVGRFFRRASAGHARAAPRLRGTVAPAAGMGDWFRALHDFLKRRGVRFVAARQEPLAHEPGVTTLVCTSAPEAARLLARAAPSLAAQLASIRMLQVVTTSLLVDEGPKRSADLPGFGCLFHPQAGFHHLGVLFASEIFPQRFAPGVRAETWIGGGLLHPGLPSLPDEALRARIDADRVRLPGGQPAAPHLRALRTTRWAPAFPLYSVDLERTLAGLEAPPRGVHLLGNYLGSLGLSQIARRVEEKVTEVAA
ncbi:MAG: protoporphyrinogen/coproporphyrinogen oxidase [Planctomycetia bacterium]